MPDNKVPQDEQPEASSMNPQIRSEVVRLIRSELDRDREFVKSTVGLSLKILGVVLLVVGYFGYQRFSDIAKSVEEAAVKDVNKKLQVENPNSAIWHNIDELADIAILQANLIKLAKIEVSGQSGDEVAFDEDGEGLPDRIDKADAKRILQLFQRKTTSDQYFGDALKVLAATKAKRVAAEFKSVTDQLLLARKEDYKWIVDQPDKRKAILIYVLESPADRTDSMADLQKTIRQEIRPGNLEKWITLTEAIEFASKTADVGALPALKSLVENGSRTGSVMVAIARIRSDDPYLQSWINRASQGSGIAGQDFRDLLDVAVAQAKHDFPPPPHRSLGKEAISPSAKTLKHLVDLGLRFSAQGPILTATLAGDGESPISYHIDPVGLIATSFPGSRERAYDSAFNQLLAETLTTTDSDVKALAKLLDALQEGFDVWVSVRSRGTNPPNPVAHLEGERTVPVPRSPEDLKVAAVGEKVQVFNKGDTKLGDLQGLSEPKSISFRVRPKRGGPARTSGVDTSQ